MNRSGFSLIELLTVIAVIGILLTIGTLNFNAYQRKAQIERQTTELYSMIMTARLGAMQQKRKTALVLGPKQITYKNYSSIYENVFSSGGKVVLNSLSSNEVKKLNGATLSTLNSSTDFLAFDSRGLKTDDTTTTLVVTPVLFSGGNDCVVVQKAKTNIGRMEDDSTCRMR
jgi:prepilin-type N-terminal cleavage/methylation domain-containing protein